MKERKLGYLGHVMRGDKYKLLKLVLEGKIQKHQREDDKIHGYVICVLGWNDHPWKF